MARAQKKDDTKEEGCCFSIIFFLCVSVVRSKVPTVKAKAHEIPRQMPMRA